jgi:hypothetical protein
MASALDDLTVFREYEPRELGADGYPLAWHKLNESKSWVLDAADMVLPGGVKDVVRAVTGHRCQRCGHPYYVGKGLGVWERDDDPSDEIVPPALFDDLAPEVRANGTAGQTHWSPCDARCTHDGPVRVKDISGCWQEYGPGDDAGPLLVMNVERQAAWRILTVHHLNERKFDLRWWNLAALCQRCHLVIQRKVTMELPWPWRHSDWFRPHAAAWYALKFLGEHLTYSQTIERLDELLELGRREESTERMAL